MKNAHGGKSDAIRNWFKANPEGGNSECVAALSKLGVKPSLVSAVKAKLGGAPAKPGKKGPRGPRAAKPVAGQGVDVQTLILLKSFAESHGGIEAAKKLIADVQSVSAIQNVGGAFDALSLLFGTKPAEVAAEEPAAPVANGAPKAPKTSKPRGAEEPAPAAG